MSGEGVPAALLVRAWRDEYGQVVARVWTVDDGATSGDGQPLRGRDEVGAAVSAWLARLTDG